MPFIVLFRVPLAVFCLFWRPFQLSCTIFWTRFTPFTCCFLWSLCLFISSLFSIKTLSPRTWLITISSGWQSLNSARYCCLSSCLEIAKYWELLFNYILTSLISRSKRGWQIKSMSSHEALVQCLTVCLQYATLQLDVRVRTLYRHLTVFPGAH